MDMKIESFVMEDNVKDITKKLLEARTDILAINYLKDINSVGELCKISVFLKCQKKEVGNNFSIIAIYISTVALVLPAFEKLTPDTPYVYFILCLIWAVSLSVSVIKDGVPFIRKTNEFNSKVDYLLWLIEEEIKQRDLTIG
ncbi:hypothetical protein [Rossellomorea aquimaris]|uniref:hypothetical protein n=1 Tax=Rossellomorea aquimaris TaxID=189382 RepID=UPI0007D058EE|nr:hypothetical protein [Rossellomorea aquimaris]